MNKKELKKSKYIGILQDNEIVKSETLLPKNIERTSDDLKRAGFYEYEPEWWTNDEVVLTTRFFIRSHLSNGTDYFEDEIVRSIYSGYQVPSFKNQFEKSGLPVYVLSVYNAGAENIYILSNITDILFTKKSSIKHHSTSRIAELTVHELRDISNSKKPLHRYKEHKLVKNLFCSNSSSFVKLFSFTKRIESTFKFSNSTTTEHDYYNLNTNIVWSKIKNNLRRNNKHQVTGLIGEFLAYKHMRNSMLNPSHVQWTSLLFPRSPIDLKYNSDINTYWEIKTTRSNSSDIRVSSIELDFEENHRGDWIIMRVDISKIFDKINLDQTQSSFGFSKMLDTLLPQIIFTKYTKQDIDSKKQSSLGIRVDLSKPNDNT